MEAKKQGRVSFYEQIDQNKWKSIGLTFFVVVVLFFLVFVFAQIYDPALTGFFLVFGGVFVIADALMSYYYGDKIVLASVGAYPADPKKHLHLINSVEGLAIAAGVPAPKVYVMPSGEINAFATGRDPEHASVAVTEGLLELLERDEIEGVIGHELSHILNYDILFATLVAVLVGLVAILSNVFLRSWRFGGKSRDREGGRGGAGWIIIVGILLAIISPFIVRLVQSAVSRKREFMADASGAKLTRYPEGLASALEKIKNYNRGRMDVSEAVSHLFFTDPNKTALDAIYATHPPLDDRIRLLRAM
jgi:heat shock protein HtpX